MRLLIITDAWFPQVNGVVRSLSTVADEISALGHQVHVIGPDLFRTIPCPTYPEIRLAVLPRRSLAARIEALRPDHIHVATEGPLGLAARGICKRRKMKFTTSLHTRFPEYIHARTALPVSWGYRFLCWFHNGAARTMVATETLRREMKDRGLRHLSIWGRGVDLELFHPFGDAADRGGSEPVALKDLPRPISMYVGRVAVEKNLEAFLNLDLPGSKVIVGGGPQVGSLRRRYPDALFTGSRSGTELADHYRSADVFVFPSRTDTFGNVMLEALACGVPVAGYPVPGPIDVIGDAPVGCLDRDLGRAVQTALTMDRQACRRFAEQFSWRRCAQQFIGNLVPVVPSASSACAGTRQS